MAGSDADAGDRSGSLIGVFGFLRYSTPTRGDGAGVSATGVLGDIALVGR